MFTDLLATLDPDPYTRGKQFEHIVKWFLLNDPEYKTLLKKVWLWNEWPGRWPVEAGIDLVAETYKGKLWAIQAKAYAPKYPVTKRDIDRFLSESSQKDFVHRLLIATTDKMHPIAVRTLDNQEKPVGVVTRNDLLTADVKWPANISSITSLRPATPLKPAKPRDYQRVAIREVINGFKRHDRGQLIKACGTGKTLDALFIHEKLKCERTLILVPSLGLMKQTMKVWHANARVPFTALPVCSDATVSQDRDVSVSRTRDLGVPVTTDASEIVTFLNGTGARVVFSTYQSSPQIVEAFSSGQVPEFDLIVADEAHRTAGPVSSAFATVLDGDAIKSQRRLYMTATPRFYTGRLLGAAKEKDFELASMDDEAKYGPVFHTLSFAEAIRRGLLTDYRVVVVGVTDPRHFKDNGEGTVTRDGVTVTDIKTLAGQVGLAKAMKKYDLRRVISFHSRVGRAKQFSEEFPDMVSWMPDDQRPGGILRADYASGTMSAGERHLRLQRLAQLEDGERALLANARCLGEGIDVPTLDGVAFIDPRRSEVDIVQAVGRAIRLADNKKLGTIVIPVFIDTNSNPEKALNDSSFKPVWGVVKALRAHDDALGEKLDFLRRMTGEGGEIPDIPEKIVLDIPTRVGTEFVKAFDARLVQQTTTSWEFWYGLLLKYVSESGSAKIPSSFITPNGFRLGAWAHRQKKQFNSLTLKHQRLLKTLPGWNTSIGWTKGYRCYLEYVDKYGDPRVPSEYVCQNRFKLGPWVIRQKRNFNSLSKERKALLENIPGWTTASLGESITSRWYLRYTSYQQYVNTYKTTSVTRNYIDSNGFHLGDWVHRQVGTFNSLDQERKVLLNNIPGWTTQLYLSIDMWNHGYKCYQTYQAEHGTADISPKYIDRNGFELGKWVYRQQRSFSNIPEINRKLLESIPGWNEFYASISSWKHMYLIYREHANKTNTPYVPKEYIDPNGFELGKWFFRQLESFTSLSPEYKRLLTLIPGFLTSAKQNNQDPQ